MPDPIRRHPNGCIDVGFYRAQGAAMRREAMRDAGRRLSAALARAFSGMAATPPVGWGANGKVISARIAPSRTR
jgi:hypothetical protein